jgi:hypothetical protein
MLQGSCLVTFSASMCDPHPHGEELIEAALARDLGRSPLEVVERAFDSITREAPLFSTEG